MPFRIINIGKSWIGKPDPLKYNLNNCWLRGINKTDRIVYTITENSVIIIQCRYHY